MDSIELIGLVAAILTTASFLPQVYKTWKTKEVESLSLVMYSVFAVGTVMWLAYGYFINSVPVMASNTITTLSAVLLIYYKIKYGKKK